MGEQADGYLQQAGAGVAGLGWGTGKVDRRIHATKCNGQFKRLFESNV
jgi:hypothetical protein